MSRLSNTTTEDTEVTIEILCNGEINMVTILINNQTVKETFHDTKEQAVLDYKNVQRRFLKI